MHINGIQPVPMIYHDIIAHGTVIGRAHYRPAVGRQNRRPAGRGKIHAVMEFLHSQSRMHAVTIFIGYSFIRGEGKLKHPSVIGNLRFIQFLQLLSLCRSRRLQCSYCGILGRDIRFVFLKRRLFIADIP